MGNDTEPSALAMVDVVKCPEQGCHGGVLHYGVGPLHEQQRTMCPRCQGTGEVPDVDESTRDSNGGCLTSLVGTLVGWVLFGIVGFIAFVVISVGGYLAFSADSPFRGGGAEFEAALPDPDDSARGLTLGSCVDEPFRGDAFLPVDCSVAHGGEVFSVIRVERTDGDEWPTDSDFHDLGGEQCQRWFDSMKRISPPIGDLFFTTGYSSEEEWVAGDRYILCLLVAGTGDATLPPGRAVPN